MSKETNDPQVISDAAPDISHYPIVAEGSGKTAQNEGAQAKTVYNVRPERSWPASPLRPALLIPSTAG